MNDFVRAALLGTAQVPPSDGEVTGSAVDAVVAGLDGVERERALLLGAGGLGLLRRGARAPARHQAAMTAAAAETLAPVSARFAEIVATLLGNQEPELLAEVLTGLGHARRRLPETLLPAALAATVPPVRAALRPLLGERGRWLATHRPEWRWALAAAPDGALPADLDARWHEGTAAERRALLAATRAADPERARALVAAAWPKEKAAERAAWLEVLEAGVGAADEPLLAGMLADRSATVRVAAARLLWRLPESALAGRLRERADALVAFASGGVLGKLRAVVGGGSAGRLEVTLPPEAFDAAWEREGLIETPPPGMGRRQWWLAQMLGAVPPDHWSARFDAAAATLVAAAQAHELGEALLDGLTHAALVHDARAWFAPLWDAWMKSGAMPRLRPDALAALSARLDAAEAEPRMLALLDGSSSDWLLGFARPWPRAVAARFVTKMQSVRPTLTPLLSAAALAIPIDLLPAPAPPPASGDDGYAAHAYARAFEQFHAIASVRRALAQEMAS